MTDTQEISAAFPFESKFATVDGSKMHYIDVGEGDPILFLHGNPTSSYLWRNIIPHLSDQARCIAVDLIGMGKSDHPDIPYRYDDHYDYLCGFIDALGIGSNLTLVIHDWGSGLGFRWAHDHENGVKAIAFMEAMIRGLSLDDMPGSLRIAMRMMRAPGTGWAMISGANIFLKKMLPDLTYAEISPDALAYYRSAFPTIASRKAVRQWPRELPLDGVPADNAAIVDAYREWLTHTDVPKLLFYGNAGIAIKEAEVAWCRENLSNLTAVDLGDAIHFIQETHPDTIGAELSKWYAGL
jgi:haloalkane dehalogenase